MAFLQRVYGDRRNSVFEIEESSITIGRHKDCDLVIDSQAVSRRHAEIFCKDGDYFLKDLDSRNGTVVDGVALDGTIQLRDWHRIEFSTLAFEFNRFSPLDDESASQKIGAAVIAVQDTPPDSEAASDHRVVTAGDEISLSETTTDQLIGHQIAARMNIVSGESGWPIINDSTLKLNLAMRLVSSMRRAIRLEETLDEIQKSIFELIAPADCVAIILRSCTDGRTFVARAAARDSDQEVEICQPVVSAAMQRSEALFYLNQRRGQLATEESTLNYVICLPLLDAPGGVLGAIHIDTGFTARAFDRSVMEKMVVLGQLISVFIENALEVELEVAQTASSGEDVSLLWGNLATAVPPRMPGFRVAHRVRSEQHRSTTIIDYVKLANGKAAAYLLEVEGANQVAERSVQATRLLVQSLVSKQSPDDAISKLIEHSESPGADAALAVTAGVLAIDSQHETVSIASTGHCVCIIVRTQTPDSAMLSGTDLSVTVTASSETCGQEEIQLEDGEYLCLFSEGVLRLTGATGQAISMTELSRQVEASLAEFPQQPESAIMESLDRFRGSTPLADDIAVVVVSREEQKSLKTTRLGGDTRMDLQEEQ